MNVLCRNFILSDFCQICSSFFCFFRALSVGTPTFIIEPKFFTFLPKKVNNPFVRSTETIPFYGKAAV